jgi:hypothetical protein
MTRYEQKHQPLAPPWVFLRRVLRSFLVTLTIVAVSLSIGTLGYHYFGNLAWLDALLNAAMILTGMGPVDRMETSAGKLFSTFYALFSGIVFLTLVAVMAAPIYHRFMHQFHLETEASVSHSDAKRK